MLTRPDCITQRWKKHFSILLNNNKRHLAKLEAEPLQDQTCEDSPITLRDLRMVLKRIEMGWMPLHDKFTHKVLKIPKAGGRGSVYGHLAVSTDIKTISEDRDIGIIIQRYKKGDNLDCCNHRAVTLLSVPRKLFFRIFKWRVRR